MTKLALYQFGLFLQQIYSAESDIEILKATKKFMQEGREIEQSMFESMNRLEELEKRVGGNGRE